MCPGTPHGQIRPGAKYAQAYKVKVSTVWYHKNRLMFDDETDYNVNVAF